jgi:thiamine transporter ThiT
MKIHPKLAGGIFGLLYLIIGLIIEKIIHKDPSDFLLYYIIGFILASFVYKFFADRYDGDSSV